MKRHVYDCDMCKARDIQPVEVRQQCRDDYVTVHLCNQCAASWIARLLSEAMPDTILDLFHSAGMFP